MGVGIKASDWGVGSITNLSAAEGVSAGVWVYAFNSPTANETFVSLLGGFGLGASIIPGGGAKPSDIKRAIDAFKAIVRRVRFKTSVLEGVPYTRLNCITPFSVQDFDFCLGRVTSARVSAGPIAYGPTYISAAPITVLNVGLLGIGGLIWNPCYFMSAGSMPGTASVQPLNPAGLDEPRFQATAMLGVWGRLTLDS
jgi:hypothetical protein